MKNRLLYVFCSLVILTTTTGFGFMESSTIMQGHINRQTNIDSVRKDSYNIYFSNHSSLTKKEVEKPVSDQITKSIIQSIANLVKNATQIILRMLVETGKIILMVIIKFFIG